MRFRLRTLLGTLAMGTIVLLCLPVSKPVMTAPAAHAMQHADRRHMHMRNWALEPTGKVGVSPLDPMTIPKYVNELTKPPVFVADNPGARTPHYTVTYKAIHQQLLPSGFPSTEVYAYGGVANFAEADQRPDIRTTFSTPGPTFEAIRGRHIRVHFVNQIDGGHIFPVDPTIMFANPNNRPAPQPPFKPFPPGYGFAQNPVPVVTHLHGGVTPSEFDGFPDSWFTKGELKKGPTFTTSTFEYFNAQLATTLWYHDHTLGMTRLTVAAGLAGAYLLRDRNDAIAPLLPSGRFEIPLLIQDRAFNDDGSIHFTQEGNNPDVHPYWDPEYFGDTIMVNGKVWPRLKVARRQYRFRIINASNARFYNLKMSNGMSYVQIGGDGSYLPAPVTLTESLVAPAERIDILVDFSKQRPGTKIVLLNTANQPFPGGDPNDPNTTGQVMRFDVQDTPAVAPPQLPAKLIDIPELVETEGIGNPKLFTLNEHESDADEPLEVLIDGQNFHSPITELPRVGTTEAWYFQNLTEDAHPVHIHLVEFQLEDRQDIDVERFKAYWESLNGSTLPLNHPTIRANVEDAIDFPPTGTPRDFLTGAPEPPSPAESGWKDTFVAPPGKVTRVRIRFAPQYTKESDLVPGFNPFPFDATAGPGYVWHCHILDHEDNDMMRPMKMTPPTPAATARAVRQPVERPTSRNRR